MKQIVRLRIELYGAYLDLVDKPAAVSINLDTGCIQLNEGEGADRLNGVIILPEDVTEIRIRESNGDEELSLVLVDGTEHIVGRSSAFQLTTEARRILIMVQEASGDWDQWSLDTRGLAPYLM